MREQQLLINGIELYTESFGNASHPAILLIMGAQSSMVWWEEAFCERLADTGHYVIRYDNRDVGRSTVYELGAPGYTFEDMADDAIHILDAYGIARAHIVGMSMGGLLTQIVALRHPERVLTATLLATSNFAPDLPPMEEKVLHFFAIAGAIDWTSEQEVVEFTIGKWRILTGTKHPFDEDRVRQLAQEELRRSRRFDSMNNHGMVTGGEGYLQRTAEINIPTLVIHGTADPIIPYAHGVALANVIPGAALLTLEGTGHELHAGDWERIIEEIVAHTQSNTN